MSDISNQLLSHFEDRRPQDRITSPLPLASLVTFDLNLSNLQEYLNKVTSLVNKNTLQINSLTEDVSHKMSAREGIELLQAISYSIPSDLGGKKFKSSTWEEGINVTSSSLENFAAKVQDLEKFKLKVRNEFKDLNEKISQKIDSDKFESEKDGLENKINEKMNKEAFSKKVYNLEDAVKRLEDQFVSRVLEIDKKVSDIRAEVQWKINDCEKLLKLRVNEQFVWDALATVESRIKKQAESQALSKLDTQKEQFSKFQSDLKKIEEDLKKSLSQIENDLPKKIDLSQFQAMAEEKEKSDKKVENLEESIKEINLKLLNDYSESIKKLFTQADHFKSDLDKKAEQSSVLELFSTLKSFSPEEFKDLLRYKEKSIGKFQKIDDKFEKLAKAMDLSIIKRAIASKADEEQTKEEFLSVGQRLLNLENGQVGIWKELEGLGILTKKLFQSLEEFGSGGSALITKKTFNKHCLSCGRGDLNPGPSFPHVQGVDGKYYKANSNTFRTTTGSDWRSEDFDIASQKSPVNIKKKTTLVLSPTLPKEVTKSVSSKMLSPDIRFRPESARK